MRFHLVLALLDADTPLAIEKDYQIFKYFSVTELREDSLFLDEIWNMDIDSMWFSKNLYECMVFKLK